MRVSGTTKLKFSILGATAIVFFGVLPGVAQVGFGSTSTRVNGRSVGTTSSGSGFSSGNAWVNPAFGNVVTGRGVGTSTGEAPTYYGGASPVYGLGGAPIGVGGAVAAPGSVGQFGYYNNNGLGYYSSSPLMQQYPVYPAPVSLGDNYFAFGGLSARLGYWRAPSGYYYPWCSPVYLPGVVYQASSPIYAMNQGAIATANPPVGMIINDMRLFLDEAKSKRQIDQSNYENVFNSLNEITARAADFSARGGGTLNASDETRIRTDLDVLAAQIARSLNP